LDLLGCSFAAYVGWLATLFRLGEFARGLQDQDQDLGGQAGEIWEGTTHDDD
jgi:hypothetical protein